jgi:hypothetical protein
VVRLTCVATMWVMWRFRDAMQTAQTRRKWQGSRSWRRLGGPQKTALWNFESSKLSIVNIFTRHEHDFTSTLAHDIHVALRASIPSSPSSLLFATTSARARTMKLTFLQHASYVHPRPGEPLKAHLHTQKGHRQRSQQERASGPLLARRQVLEAPRYY